MIAKYQVLFKLAFTHEYYKNGKCKDFKCLPTEACAQIIKRHKLIFKANDDGLQILYKLGEDQKPFIPIEKNTNFSFVFTLENTSFLNFTDCDWKKGSVLYYKQQGTQEVLKGKVKNRIYNGQFPVEFNPEDTTSIDVEVSDLVQKVVFAQSVVADAKTLIPTGFNMSALPTGKYKVSTSLNNEVPTTDNIYLNNEAFGTIPFGHVDIKYNEVENFNIHFPAKLIDWSYYVVMKKEPVNQSIGILYKSNNTNGRYTGMNLPFVNRPNDFDGKATTLLFTTDQIPIYEEQLNGLQLISINNGDLPEHGTALISSLPKPSINKLKPEIFIYI